MPEDESTRASDEERFARFVGVLVQADLEAEHLFLGSAADLCRFTAEDRDCLVFSAAHRVPNGRGGFASVHAALEAAGIPFVGSSSRVIDLALSKPGLKARWSESGVRTPAWFVVPSLPPGGADDESAAIPSAGDFPYIVKPAKEGNSRGIDADSVVRSHESLLAKVRSLRERFGEVLVESFLGSPERREFTVAMIGDPDRGLILPAEIVIKGKAGNGVVTNADKEEHRAQALPVADGELAERLTAFARRAFAVAGVRDYSRGDFILDRGELWAIEVNGQPMVPDRWFAACSAAAGLDEKGYLAALVLAALGRLEREGRAPFAPPRELSALVPAAMAARLLS